MGIKRTSHAVYDAKYHLVWTPKYRKWVLRDDLRQKVKELFLEIAQLYDTVCLCAVESAAAHT